MVRHATSHGISVLMCTIISAFLIDVIRPILPHFMLNIEKTSQFIISFFALPFSVKEFNIVMVASILALFWGMFFRLQNRKYYIKK